MLIQFRVENHRSIKDEKLLSLVAESADRSDDVGLIRPAGIGEALLPAVALYGANASGKTNVLLALAFMRMVVGASYRSWEPGGGVPREPFAFAADEDRPSLYEVDIVLDGVRYQYGFTVDSRRILEEWLYAWPNKRRQLWFSRAGDEFTFGRSLHGENAKIRELTRVNSLFLSTAAQNNHAQLLPIHRWFQRIALHGRGVLPLGGRTFWLSSGALYRIFDDIPDGQDVGDSLQADTEPVVRWLGMADTGIIGMRVKVDASNGHAARTSRTTPRIELQHQADDPERGWLPLEAESAGTVALLDLAARVIPVLLTRGILIVDELEASLHPMVAGRILRMFCDPAQNPRGAQIIFTTHDTNLLGNTLGYTPLRRDQVWLTEKDEHGATDLYSLTDFHPRKPENLERGYLQGRYGAIPFLDDLMAPTTSDAGTPA